LAQQVEALQQVQMPGQQLQQHEEGKQPQHGEEQQPQKGVLQPTTALECDVVPDSSSSRSPNADVPGCGDSAACHPPAVSSGTAAIKAPTGSAPASSTDSTGEGGVFSTGVLLGTAARVQHACRPRVQLVGCSSPCCTNQSGPSAEGLVAGRKGVRCGGCRVARYCSPACQKEDWAQHRHVCRRLGAAASQ
jgi:hypothetical protein